MLAGMETLKFTGPARCFDSEEACFEAVAKRQYREGEVLVFETDEQASAQVTMHVRALRPGIASYDLSIDGTPSGLTTVILP